MVCLLHMLLTSIEQPVNVVCRLSLVGCMVFAATSSCTLCCSSLLFQQQHTMAVAHCQAAVAPNLRASQYRLLLCCLSLL
jgi:hypothetical protein